MLLYCFHWLNITFLLPETSVSKIIDLMVCTRSPLGMGLMCSGVKLNVVIFLVVWRNSPVKRKGFLFITWKQKFKQQFRNIMAEEKVSDSETEFYLSAPLNSLYLCLPSLLTSLASFPVLKSKESMHKMSVFMSLGNHLMTSLKSRFWFIRSGVGPRFCIAHKLPGDTGPHFE